MTTVTYILTTLVILIVLIDLFLKKKNNRDIKRLIESEKSDDNRSKKVFIIFTTSLLLLTSIFFITNSIFYDGKLTDNSDNISLLQNLTLEKISSNEIISSDSMWVGKSTMQKLSCIVVDSFGNYNGVIIDGYRQGLWQYFYANKNLRVKANYINGGSYADGEKVSNF